MKLLKQSETLNFPEICLSSSDKRKNRHGRLLPETIRCIICGPSNCGKTNVMIGLLLHEQGLCYSNVYLYSKTIFQPKYVYLENVFNQVPGIIFKKFSSNDKILNPLEALPYSIMIFDDVACENQKVIRDYFAMGRHKNVDCFYLNQTYSKIPKQLIRDNTNLLIIFKQDDINLKHIYHEHVGSDMSWSTFHQMCCNVWQYPYGFIVINKDCKKNDGAYRKGFDTFIIIE